MQHLQLINLTRHQEPQQFSNSGKLL